jgi:hypothetical protein
MKLNFRLDLNTIVLVLLIVVFSVIIFYNIKKHTIIEGIGETSQIQEANETLKTEQTKLDEYVADKMSFDDAFSKLNGQDTVVINETGYIRDTVTNIPQSPITPNLHVMDAQLTASQDLLDVYNTTVNTIKNKFNLTGTNSTVSAAIQTRILTQTVVLDTAKTTLNNLITFIIKEPVTSADRSVVITIETSSVIPPTYTITSIPPVMDMQYTFDANPPAGNAIATVTGLTNNTSYKFKVIADYGNEIKYEVTTTTAVVPRGKPSATAVGFTGYANLTIVPPSDGLVPRDYTISSDPTVLGLPVTQSTLTKRIDGLANDTLYTLSVVANYIGGSSLPATATVTPRNAPTGTVQRGNKSAIVTVVPPIGNTTLTPTSYLVSGYKSLQSTSTVPLQQFPASNTTATFTGLENGTEYTFNIVAIYPDESRSSPSTSIKVTPYDAPKPVAPVTAADGGASLTITKPTTTPKREPFTIDKVIVTRTAVNLMFSIKNPVSSMSSFSIKIRNGANSGKTKTSNNITDSLWFGKHEANKEYLFDITVTYTDGTKVVLSNKKYTTLAAPEINAVETKTDIKIYVANPDITTMSSFYIIQQNGAAKGKKKTSTTMSDKLSLGPYRSNVEYEFDVFINYKDGETYKKNNAKFRTLK